MFIRMFISVLLDFAFLGDTIFEGGFVDGVCFSGHGALVSCNLVGLDKDGISWDLHAFIDLHDVSHEYIVLVDLHQFPLPDYRYPLALIGHHVQLCELPFLRVVVSCSHQPANCDCYQDNKPLDPGSAAATIAIGSSNFDGYGDEAGGDQNFQDEIVEGIFEVFAEGGKRRLVLFIGT